MNLEGWRNEIDEIDAEILRLLENRAQIVAEIGKAKAKAGIPILNEERERQILRRVSNAANEVLSAESAVCVFSCIINESKRIQSEIVSETVAQSAKVC